MNNDVGLALDVCFASFDLMDKIYVDGYKAYLNTPSRAHTYASVSDCFQDPLKITTHLQQQKDSQAKPPSIEDPDEIMHNSDQRSAQKPKKGLCK